LWAADAHKKVLQAWQIGIMSISSNAFKHITPVFIVLLHANKKAVGLERCCIWSGPNLESQLLLQVLPFIQHFQRYLGLYILFLFDYPRLLPWFIAF